MLAPESEESEEDVLAASTAAAAAVIFSFCSAASFAVTIKFLAYRSDGQPY